MGNTFMFECDNFGEEANYHETYCALGGNRLSADVLRDVIDPLYKHMRAISRLPENLENFGTVMRYLRAMPVSATLPPSELALLVRVFAEHEAGRISPSYAGALRELRRSHRLGVVSNVFSDPAVFEREFERAPSLKLRRAAECLVQGKPLLPDEASGEVGRAGIGDLFDVLAA